MRGSFKGKSLISFIKISIDALRHSCRNQVLSKGHSLTTETDSQGEEGNLNAHTLLFMSSLLLNVSYRV